MLARARALAGHSCHASCLKATNASRNATSSISLLRSKGLVPHITQAAFISVESVPFKHYRRWSDSEFERYQKAALQRKTWWTKCQAQLIAKARRGSHEWEENRRRGMMPRPASKRVFIYALQTKNIWPLFEYFSERVMKGLTVSRTNKAALLKNIRVTRDIKTLQKMIDIFVKVNKQQIHPAYLRQLCTIYCDLGRLDLAERLLRHNRGFNGKMKKIAQFTFVSGVMAANYPRKALGLIERTWKVKTPRWLNIVSQAGTMMIAHAKLGNEGTVRLIWTNLQNYINSTNPDAMKQAFGKAHREFSIRRAYASMMYLSALAELGKSDELLAVLPDIPRHTQDVTQSKRRHMYRYLLRTVYLSGQTELLNHLIPSNWKVDSAHSMRLQCLSYSPAPNVEELLNAFQEASKVSNPSPKNYNAVLRGMVRSGAIDAALDKLSAFKKAGFLPNNETQEILLEAYVAKGDLALVESQARTLLQSRRLFRDQLGYVYMAFTNAAKSGTNTLEQATKLFEMTKNQAHSRFSLRWAIECFAANGDTATALRVFKRNENLQGCMLDVDICNVVLRIADDDAAMTLFRRMQTAKLLEERDADLAVQYAALPPSISPVEGRRRFAVAKVGEIVEQFFFLPAPARHGKYAKQVLVNKMAKMAPNATSYEIALERIQDTEMLKDIITEMNRVGIEKTPRITELITAKNL